MTKQQILDIVTTQVTQLVETLPEKQKFEAHPSTILFGNGSKIDSLSLVSVIVDLEMIFSSDYNFDLSLTDDRAMTREISPFDTINTLVDYIFELTSELNQP
jgi:acyl carrier protein